MIKRCERTDRLAALLRSILLAIVSSEGLYLMMTVLFEGVLITDVFMTRSHYIVPLREYVIHPWMGALLAFYLARERKHVGLDTRLLMLLVLWLSVPFVMRFGTEGVTMRTVYGFVLCFMVFYVSVRESEAVRRGQQLDIACAAMCLLSFIWGGALLYCAVTRKAYCSYWDTMHFGLVNGQLWHGMHYNVTAMLAQTCMLMCLTGLCRHIKKPQAILYLLGVIMMALVVILTQSRTSRYAMLLVFAVGTWNGLAEYLPIRKGLLRHGAALVCALVVLVGGYKLCGAITNAALAHYAGQPVQLLEAVLPSAIAEDETAKPRPQAARDQRPDASLSDRTTIWKNVFKSWKNNPKHMIIGNGAGRTQWLLAEGTVHEWAGAVGAHNAYLQFAAEFGWIGFGILVVFMLVILPSVLRVFFAHGEKRMPGGCALCMLVIAILATGMMECAPLEPLTPMNVALFFALAQLVGWGRDLKEKN